MFGIKKSKKSNKKTINELKRINMNLENINSQYEALNKAILDYTSVMTEYVTKIS